MPHENSAHHPQDPFLPACFKNRDIHRLWLSICSVCFSISSVSFSPRQSPPRSLLLNLSSSISPPSLLRLSSVSPPLSFYILPFPSLVLYLTHPVYSPVLSQANVLNRCQLPFCCIRKWASFSPHSSSTSSTPSKSVPASLLYLLFFPILFLPISPSEMLYDTLPSPYEVSYPTSIFLYLH